MNNIEFLRNCEKLARERAVVINPCADAGDKIKSAILERADQFKACADEIRNQQAAIEKIMAISKKGMEASEATFDQVVEKLHDAQVALNQIADNLLTSEVDDDSTGDFESAYDAMIQFARHTVDNK